MNEKKKTKPPTKPKQPAAAQAGSSDLIVPEPICISTASQPGSPSTSTHFRHMHVNILTKERGGGGLRWNCLRPGRRLISHTLEIHREIKQLLHFASPTPRAKTSFGAISSCYANNNNKKIIRRGERGEKTPSQSLTPLQRRGDGRRWGGVGWLLTKDADLIVAKRSRFR